MPWVRMDSEAIASIARSAAQQGTQHEAQCSTPRHRHTALSAVQGICTNTVYVTDSGNSRCAHWDHIQRWLTAPATKHVASMFHAHTQHIGNILMSVHVRVPKQRGCQVLKTTQLSNTSFPAYFLSPAARMTALPTGPDSLLNDIWHVQGDRCSTHHVTHVCFSPAAWTPPPPIRYGVSGTASLADTEIDRPRVRICQLWLVRPQDRASQVDSVHSLICQLTRPPTTVHQSKYR